MKGTTRDYRPIDEDSAVAAIRRYYDELGQTEADVLYLLVVCESGQMNVHSGLRCLTVTEHGELREKKEYRTYVEEGGAQ